MAMPLIAAGATIASTLRWPGLDPLETRILASHALGLSRVQLVTRSENALDDAQAKKIEALFTRRIAGEPIAYILGEREFYGLPFHVTPDVLIPRHETELLVELAIEHAADNGRVLDMGTGSGAIAVALASACRDLVITGIDVSEAALNIARGNADRNKVDVTLMQSDWYASLNGKTFDLIVSNPPYIADKDLHLSQGDLRFEPAAALTDRADGLSAIRTIIDGAPSHLSSGGWLLLEHGYDQSEAVRSLLTKAGFEEVRSWKDISGIERASGGRLPAWHEKSP